MLICCIMCCFEVIEEGKFFFDYVCEIIVLVEFVEE